MTTNTTTALLFSDLRDAVSHYGQRELLFQHKTRGLYALADNADGALIDGLTAAGCYLVGPGSKVEELLDQEEEYRAWLAEERREDYPDPEPTYWLDHPDSPDGRC